MRTAVRRTLIVLALAALLALGWLGVEGGQYLLHEDPLQHADVIFVLGGTRFERPLEAVDIYKAGYAQAIVLSPDRPDPADALVRARGVELPRDVDTVGAAMVKLGVPASAISIPEGSMDNTAQEAELLRSLTQHRGWHSVIVITSKYHTRRAGFAMRRALRGTGVEVIMRASRYDQFDPLHWWRSRSDLRYMLTEWEKLVAYRLGLAGG